MEKGVSLTMKNIGKPCTGKPYARFDEESLGYTPWLLLYPDLGLL